MTAELRRMRSLAVHEVLGVSRDADAETVRLAWMDLVRRHHPDLVARHHAPAIVHLAEDSALQAHLRGKPEHLPAAIEEFLRLHAPYRVFARTPREDVAVHGRFVRQGEPIALIYPSANRDPAVFDDPDEFVLHRKNNSHLAFGRGAHRCPAATMGRVELNIALETLLARTRSFELDGPVEMMNWLEYGPRSVPLRVDAA